MKHWYLLWVTVDIQYDLVREEQYDLVREEQ